MLKNRILYKRFHGKLPSVDQMQSKGDLQWFSTEKGYGSDDTYGPNVAKFKIKKPLKLLDIGNGAVRTLIIDTLSKVDPAITRLGDPDEQYSGGDANKKFHNILKKHLGKQFDGTTINPNNLTSGGRFVADDMDGPSEVVLWNFDKIDKV